MSLFSKFGSWVGKTASKVASSPLLGAGLSLVPGGGLLGAAAKVGGMALGAGPKGGGGSFGTGFGTGYSIGTGIGQAIPQKYPTPDAFGRALGVPAPGDRMKLLPSHQGLNLGVAEVPPGQKLTVFQGGSAWAGRFRMNRQQAIEIYSSSGMVPPGFHLTGPRSLYSVARNRRMNVLNPRALSRAMRRARGFAKYASRVVSFVKHGAHGAKFKRARRKRA